MKAGFIGYRNFADKLRRMFQQSGLVGEFAFYHPHKAIDGLNCSNNLEDLLDCDFIVIASPDSTHGSFLRQLTALEYQNYIFCEKVPVVDRQDLQFLKDDRNSRLYFDFKYRKSGLGKVLLELPGQALHIGHRCSHGLAFKEDYQNGWRSDLRTAPLGVFQLSGIHFFDFLVFTYGRPLSFHAVAKSLSPYGDSVDNFSISLEFENGLNAALFYSYTSPYCFDMNVATTEVLFELDDSAFVIRGPRETFSDKGLFTTPPIFESGTLDLRDEALSKSIRYFLDVVVSGKTFDEAQTEDNLLSTELFLDILDEVRRTERIQRGKDNDR